MAIEHARVFAHPKPWGAVDLRPWSSVGCEGTCTGELWYERPGIEPPSSSLLLKLLFTSQPLSIQVHPDDTYAQSVGLPNGKTEAWYVLSAVPGAVVGLGLKHPVSPRQLRQAIGDGSISELIVWQGVAADDVIFVPAGTIHAIGAGLVVAEIQQRSDATFRLYDHGRQRELHIDRAVTVAKTGPAEFQARPNRLSDERTLLVSNPHFVFERIELAPDATWSLDAERETWLLVLGGSARAGAFDLSTGTAIFAEADRLRVHAGNNGLECLVAYTGAGGPVRNLLQRAAPAVARRPNLVPMPADPPHTQAAPATRRTGIRE